MILRTHYEYALDPELEDEDYKPKKLQRSYSIQLQTEELYGLCKLQLVRLIFSI